MPYCRKCGAEISEDVKYCPFCGTPVKAEARPREEKWEKHEKYEKREKAEKHEKAEEGEGDRLGALMGGLIMILPVSYTHLTLPTKA